MSIEQENLEKAIKYLKQYNETPIERNECPLCNNKKYILKNEYSIDELIKKWCEKYSFNPFSACYEGKILERRVCTKCGTNYYNYFVPDTEEFYEELTELHPIYSKNKWDYDKALIIVQKYSPNSILDIGCGYGYFIEKIKNATDLAEGTEFNPKAYKACKEKNINVYNIDLSQIQQKYDLITCFQVLEHIRKPDEFIKNAISLLNKNGLLLFITPNPNSELIKYEPGILELPPHHNLDISKKTYEFIAKEFDLEILEYEEQELLINDYRIYLRNKFKIDLDKNTAYPLYINEKNNLIGKSHLVLYKKK